jgi:putative salt-induced outer membrane protein
MRKTLPFAAFVSVIATPAAALDLPEGVRVMIEAAIDGGDPQKVATVIELARQTHPEGAAEIDALETAFRTGQEAAAQQQAAQEREALEDAGLFERWSGKGQVGAFRSTGNSENIGLTAALRIERQGADWTHLLRGNADYQETRGITTRERFLAAYEPRLQLGDDMFVYGLTQFERDRISGFSARYIVSGGLGWSPIEGDGISLAVRAGPAYRYTDFIAEPDRERLAGLAAVDFDWQMADRITVTQDASVVVATNNTTLSLLTGMEFGVTDRLSTRVSYQVDYESDPPVGKLDTDTITRFTLVYGF